MGIIAVNVFLYNPSVAVPFLTQSACVNTGHVGLHQTPFRNFFPLNKWVSFNVEIIEVSVTRCLRVYLSSSLLIFV